MFIAVSASIADLLIQIDDIFGPPTNSAIGRWRRARTYLKDDVLCNRGFELDHDQDIGQWAQEFFNITKELPR